MEGILPSELSEGASKPCQYLDLGLLASGTLRPYISTVEVIWFAVLLYSSPSKLTKSFLPLILIINFEHSKRLRQEEEESLGQRLGS